MTINRYIGFKIINLSFPVKLDSSFFPTEIIRLERTGRALDFWKDLWCKFELEKAGFSKSCIEEHIITNVS